MLLLNCVCIGSGSWHQQHISERLQLAITQQPSFPLSQTFAAQRWMVEALTGLHCFLQRLMRSIPAPGAS